MRGYLLLSAVFWSFQSAAVDKAANRVRGVRVWNSTLEWLLLTTRPVETLDQVLDITAWYSRRWSVGEFLSAAYGRNQRRCRPGARRIDFKETVAPISEEVNHRTQAGLKWRFSLICSGMARSQRSTA